MIRTRSTTHTGQKSATISLGLLAAIGGLTVLVAGLTLAPDQAVSSPVNPAGLNHAQSRAPAPVHVAVATTSDTQRPSGDAARRAVRVVYSGLITR